jgi:hypothetical protein
MKKQKYEPFSKHGFPLLSRSDHNYDCYATGGKTLLASEG